MNYDYIIIKRGYMYSTCSKCGGEGVKRRIFRKMEFVEDCSICFGEGRVIHTIDSECSLVDAINDLREKLL